LKNWTVVLCQDVNFILFEHKLLSAHAVRAFKDIHENFRVVVSSDPVDGYFSAAFALVNQHKLALVFSSISFSSLFECQGDRTHTGFAGGQPISGSE
jgi:hypothetical protein